MKKNIILFFGFLGISIQVNSKVFVPITNNVGPTEANISYRLSNTADRISTTFLTTEPIKFQFTINVKNEDIGQSGSLYLVANYKDNWYQKNAEGLWIKWDRQATTLNSFSQKILEKQETMTVLKEETLSSGEFIVYGGYQSDSVSSVFYNQSPASILVFEKDGAALHQVKSQPLLSSYFAHGGWKNAGFSPEMAGDFSPPADSMATVTSAVSSVSQTNLQEIGVDEADRIKTDGDHLYVLESCKTDSNKQCLASYTIQASPAANIQLEQVELGDSHTYQGGLYLSEFNDKKHIIHLADSSNYSVIDAWYYPSYWQGNNTNIKIIDVSQPEKMDVQTHISLDTSILSSRVIDGVLYLISRKNSFYTFPEPVDLTGTSMESAIPVVPETQTVNDLLPVISFNNGTDGVPVVQATDCYIPVQDSNKGVDNTIITITAIPLDSPTTHYSSCIAGSVDTFYMSTNALYLATSRYSFSVTGNEISFLPGFSERTTEIHKFALAEGALDYRGSGTVPGHLGWKADKQPFRMGEYNEVIKVATSKGMTWNETSTTRVSVLREAEEGNRLEEISFVDNLGKPGERLFAARFIKDRGYLVTFRQTDPLYVLDFKQPEQPTVLGELEINGYSDYLHPVGDNYLLGIGKDAIPGDNPDQGALYQGVKLSLFDVSSAENLSEIESVVVGKRGTESAVLSDHHALAWLPSEQEESATLAIPVQLNDQEGGQYNQDYTQPSAFYEWTHTGLYTFHISTGENPGIEMKGKLISDIPPKQCNEAGNYCSFKGQYTTNDRAVIQEDTIHYIHNNAVYSSAIADLE